jgi:hypothetical protein
MEWEGKRATTCPLLFRDPFSSCVDGFADHLISRARLSSPVEAETREVERDVSGRESTTKARKRRRKKEKKLHSVPYRYTVPPSILPKHKHKHTSLNPLLPPLARLGRRIHSSTPPLLLLLHQPHQPRLNDVLNVSPDVLLVSRRLFGRSDNALDALLGFEMREHASVDTGVVEGHCETSVGAVRSEEVLKELGEVDEG